MHSHQQMMRVNSALRECLSFGPLPSPELKDSVHFHREAATGDQSHAACHRAAGSRAIRRNYPVCFVYFDMGECPTAGQATFEPPPYTKYHYNPIPVSFEQTHCAPQDTQTYVCVMCDGGARMSIGARCAARPGLALLGCLMRRI